MGKLAIGTDIGGSHISCALVDLEKEAVLQESLVNKPVNNQAGADKILNTWSLTLKECLNETDVSQIAGIGFAMPGPFDYENGIALFKGVPKYHNLYGIDVSERIREMISMKENQHIRFINDAASFAIGEAWMGKAAGFRHTLFITLGTGFGSAFLESGIPVVERNDVPEMGCVWHLPFKEGISDDYFSTRWIRKRYEEKTGKKLAGVKEIVGQISTESSVRAIFSEFGDNLGTFLAPWITGFNAEILVIGGNISNAYHLFEAAFKESLVLRNVKIITQISSLMEHAALIGSARLLDESFWKKVKPLIAKM